MFEIISKRYGKQWATDRPTCLRPWRDAVRGEDGFVLITVMFVMVLLLVLALAAADSVVLETSIAANHQEYTDNFYRADGAAKEMAQVLANELDSNKLNPNMNPTGWVDWQQRPPLVDPDAAPDDATTQAVDTQYDNLAQWQNNPRPRASAALNDPNQHDPSRQVRQMAVRTKLTGGDLAGSSSFVAPGGGKSGPAIIYEVYGFAPGQKGTAAVNIAIGYMKEDN
jgi:Tfp pilus assembly protein PilX